MTAIRIVTIDDQAVYRAGIRHTFAQYADLALVGEAGCSSEALAVCVRQQPDLLLCNAALPGGMALLATLRARCPATKIVVLTEQVDRVLLNRAFQLGVSGYLLKDMDPAELVQGVRSAVRGLLTMAAGVIEAVRQSNEQSDTAADDLSPREQSVLSLLLRGLSNDAIAARLHISCATVKFHLRNIYGKLGVRTRAEAISVAYRWRDGTGAGANRRLQEVLRMQLPRAVGQ